MVVLTLLLAACVVPGPATAATSPTAPAPTPAMRSASVLPESAPQSIRIPALDVDAEVIGLGLRPDGSLGVPPDGTVAGWYTGAPTPGEAGSAVIAAHVDWKGEPGVFVGLRDLRPGDEVDVRRAEGTATFQVLRVDRYAKNMFPTDTVYGGVEHAGLRLITCGGSFDHEARSYSDNIVVYAGLVRAS